LKKFFAVIGIFLALAWLSACKQKPGGGAPSGGQQATVGSIAPDFELRDLSGKPYRLSTMKGKVIVLEFWATWCPPCKSSVPEFKRLYEKFRNRDFVLMALNVDEGENVPETLKNFGKENGINYPVLHDINNVAGTYNVMSIPSTFVIDKEGNISYFHMGYTEDMFEALSKEVEELLKKNA
jgi:peroxiredoxin